MVQSLTLVAVLQDAALNSLQGSLKLLEGQLPAAKVHVSFPPANLANTLNALKALQHEPHAVLLPPELVNAEILQLVQSNPKTTLVLVGAVIRPSLAPGTFFILAHPGDPSAVHLLLLKLQARRMAAHLPPVSSPPRLHGVQHLTLQQPVSPITSASPFASAEVPVSLSSTPASSARFNTANMQASSSTQYTSSPFVEASKTSLSQQLRSGVTNEITPVTPGNTGVVTHVRHSTTTSTPPAALKPQRLFAEPSQQLSSARSGWAAVSAVATTDALLKEVQKLKVQVSTRTANRKTAGSASPGHLQLPHAATSPPGSPLAQTPPSALAVARSLPSTPHSQSPSRERHPSLEDLARSHSMARNSSLSPMRERVYTRMIVSSGGGADGDSIVDEVGSTISRSSSFLSSSTARYRPPRRNRSFYNRDDESDGGMSPAHSGALPALPASASESTVDVTIGSAAGANSAAGEDIVVSPLSSEAGYAVPAPAAHVVEQASPVLEMTAAQPGSSAENAAATDNETSQDSLSFPIIAPSEPEQEVSWMSSGLTLIGVSSAPVELDATAQASSGTLPSLAAPSIPTALSAPAANQTEAVQPAPASKPPLPVVAAKSSPDAGSAASLPATNVTVAPPPIDSSSTTATASPPQARAEQPSAVAVRSPPTTSCPSPAAPSETTVPSASSTAVATAPIKPMRAHVPTAPASSPTVSPRATTGPQPWPLPPPLPSVSARAVDPRLTQQKEVTSAAPAPVAQQTAAPAAPAPLAQQTAAPAAPAPVAQQTAAPAAPAPVAQQTAAPAAPAPVAQQTAAPAAPAPVAQQTAAPAAPAPVAQQTAAPAAPAPVAQQTAAPAAPAPLAQQTAAPAAPAPVAQQTAAPAAPAPVAQQTAAPAAPAPVAQQTAAPAAPAPVAQQTATPAIVPLSQVPMDLVAQSSVASRLAAAAGAATAFGSIQLLNEDTDAGTTIKATSVRLGSDGSSSDTKQTPAIVVAAPVVARPAAPHGAPKPPTPPKAASASVPQVQPVSHIQLQTQLTSQSQHLVPSEQRPSATEALLQADHDVYLPALPVQVSPALPTQATRDVTPVSSTGHSTGVFDISKSTPFLKAAPTAGAVPVTEQFAQLGLSAQNLIPASYRTSSGIQQAALLAVDMPGQALGRLAAPAVTASSQARQHSAGQLVAMHQDTVEGAREHKRLARQRLKSHSIYVSHSDLL